MNQELNNKSVCIPVYSNRLAGVLMAKGYVLQDMKPNTRQRERNVFYFVDSPQIKKEIQDYKDKV